MDLKVIFDFLTDLKSNNNREWFQDNKEYFLTTKNIFEQFIGLLIPKLMEIDDSIGNIRAKDCIYRIYRDVRFSKDKSPYKNHFGALIGANGRKSKKAAYYIHIEPDASFIGGGIYKPDPIALKLLRTEIYYHPEEFKSIIQNKDFKSYFPEIFGEKLKLAPKGFPRDFADIDLLKYKSYAVVHKVDNKFFAQNNLIGEVMKVLKIQSDFNRFLNNALEDIEKQSK